MPTPILIWIDRRPASLSASHLRDYLNDMPGPRLTTTDFAQCLKYLEEVELVSSSEEELRAGCLAIYAKEKGEGTDLPAILGLLSEYCLEGFERL
jgi:hypothetical protein